MGNGKLPFSVRVMKFEGDPADMALALPLSLLLSIETKSRKKGVSQEKSM
jgi:hypothetical protein